MEISEFSTSSCRGRVVKALDSKSNGVSPHRFESCRQRILFVGESQQSDQNITHHVCIVHECLKIPTGGLCNYVIYLDGLGAAADDLCDHPDPGPGPRVDRQQPRPRVRVVQVLHDSHALGQGQV